jgi:hypothetical protein
LVDFLCIGAQKAATSWLHHNLMTHPGVWMPGFIKEIHYFDLVHLPNEGLRASRSKRFRGRAKRANLPRDYVEKITDKNRMYTDQWYQDIFSLAPKDLKKGEVTPNYCAVGEEGVCHVKKINPELKLIYIIRDPASRMSSSLRMFLHRMATRHGRHARSEAELIDLCNKNLSNSQFLGRGDYASNVPRWDRHFPGSMLYLPFGKVRSDPEALLRNVESFIGLEPHGAYPRADEQIHKGTEAPLPDTILGRVMQIAAPQLAFLQERFGSDFVAQIK